MSEQTTTASAWQSDGTSTTEYATQQSRSRQLLGPSRDALLGQRAAQQSATDGQAASITMAADSERPVTELPVLDPGVYLLEPTATGSRTRRQAVLGPLHGLALDTAFSNGGDVIWIDANGHATTHTLASVAPSERAFQRVHLARAFTTHQHHTLVEQIGRWLRDDAESPFGTPATDRPAVVVCPALDALYRAGECRRDAATRLVTRAVAVLASLARDHGLPVVTTRARTDDLTAPLERAATRIELERTPFGPRFECPELAFETLVYPDGDGTVQTTFAFWRQVLAERQSESVAAPMETTAGRSAAPLDVPGTGR